MKNTKGLTGVLLLTLWISNSSRDLWAQAPKYSNEFLSIGVGARSHAMANALVASVNDVTAGYWNPAGLLRTGKKYDAGLMHAEYFAGIGKFDYAGFTVSLDERSSLGMTLLRFGVDDIPNTLDLIDQDGNVRYDRIKTFSAADYAVIFSYARKLPLDGFSLGGNVKVIYRRTGSFASAWGFGLDVAAQYTRDAWMFGVVARDITSTFNIWSFNTDALEETFLVTGNELPTNSLEITLPRLLLGAGRSFRLNPSFRLLAEMDMDITFDGKRNTLIRTGVFSVDPHMGLELSFKEMIFLRMGAANLQRIPGFDQTNALTFQPNLGIGISYKNISIDYALTDIGNQSIALYSNIFSLRYSFHDKKAANP